ncbi:MAG: V-type ATP synthase subunit E [Synergistaceae bacterium]|jgi:V/A-type H+-transporting ATPase subunit E|nr:V-type ATP synthase subunit E [Synergistaceae bacterium]
MSLAQITEKIEREAREEAENILSRAREQESGVKQEIDAEVRRLGESARERFEKERPEIFRRREIVAKLDVGKIRLDAQRKLISEVYAGGLERLGRLDKKAYAAFCEKLLKKAIESGDEVIEFSGGEKYLDAAWLDAFNNKNGTKIKLSDRRGDFSGGFILNKGRIAVNCTWEMLIQTVSERLESEVVRRLFPG